MYSIVASIKAAVFSAKARRLEFDSNPLRDNVLQKEAVFTRCSHPICLVLIPATSPYICQYRDYGDFDNHQCEKWSKILDFGNGDFFIPASPTFPGILTESGIDTNRYQIDDCGYCAKGKFTLIVAPPRMAPRCRTT